MVHSKAMALVTMGPKAEAQIAVEVDTGFPRIETGSTGKRSDVNEGPIVHGLRM